MKINCEHLTGGFFSTGIFCFLLLLPASCQEQVPEKKLVTEELTVKDTSPSPDSTTAKTANLLPMITIDSSISLDYLMGKFEPTESPDFVKVEPPYGERDDLFLRKETYEAFKAMHATAEQDGISLTIRSATRNFKSQKRIWEAKWSGKRLLEGGINAAQAIPNPKERALKILEWSSMPGSSRHHWGTDIDLNAFVNSYFEQGKGLKEYQWLRANAGKFGFCQPYSPKGAARPYGYNEEKWHWSYLPLARKLSDQCRLRLRDQMISGFEGAEMAGEIGIVEKYVLGINKECL